MEEILLKFKDSGIMIISEEKLIEYIHFCLVNKVNKTKGKTSHHHILPRAKSLPFEQFSNLRENPWNGSHLLYKDHYVAHYILTQAIDTYATLSAFIAMNNLDTKNDRINEDNLISSEKFQELMELRSIKDSIYKTEEIFVDGISTTRAKEASKKQMKVRTKKFLLDGIDTNSIEQANIKRVKTMTKTIIVNGIETTIYKESSKKYSKTMKEEYKDIEGNITTKAKERSKKYSETINKKYSKDGIETSKALERGKKISETIKKSGKLKGSNNPRAKIIEVFDYNNNLVFMSHGNFEEMCKEFNFPSSLLKKSYTSNTKLFQTDRGKIQANKNNNLHLVGYYAKIKDNNGK